jgi:methylmalonyl-CoA mutase
MYQMLFQEFEDSDKKIWLDRVQRDRKGKDYNDLLWAVSDKLVMEPYYDRGEFNDLVCNDLLLVGKASSEWLNQAFIDATSYEITCLQIQEAISGGADALWIKMGDARWNDAELTELAVEISKAAIPVVFENASQYSGHLAAMTTDRTCSTTVVYDPLSVWMQGRISLSECYQQLHSLAGSLPSRKKDRPIMVGGHAFHNAGGDPVQELAFTTSLLVHYLDWFTEQNLPVDQVLDSLFFCVSVGPDYLTELSKLRALRLLHKKVCDAYGVTSKSPFIHARTSAFYETRMSPDSNFIRTTIEGMAAVAGGCDALTIVPHRSDISREKTFRARVTRNISLIMREEALLGKVADPAAGSYFLDKFTQELVACAWDLFLAVENKGGLVAAFEQNYIQDELSRSWARKLEAYQNGRVVVGVNEFVDREEMKVVSHQSEIRSFSGNFLLNRNLEEGINTYKS